jgi:hypothetical protein
VKISIELDAAALSRLFTGLERSNSGGMTSTRIMIRDAWSELAGAYLAGDWAGFSTF